MGKVKEDREAQASAGAVFARAMGWSPSFAERAEQLAKALAKERRAKKPKRPWWKQVVIDHPTLAEPTKEQIDAIFTKRGISAVVREERLYTSYGIGDVAKVLRVEPGYRDKVLPVDGENPGHGPPLLMSSKQLWSNFPLECIELGERVVQHLDSKAFESHVRWLEKVCSQRPGIVMKRRAYKGRRLLSQLRPFKWKDLGLTDEYMKARYPDFREDEGVWNYPHSHEHDTYETHHHSDEGLVAWMPDTHDVINVNRRSGMTRVHAELDEGKIVFVYHDLMRGGKKILLYEDRVMLYNPKTGKTTPFNHGWERSIRSMKRKSKPVDDRVKDQAEHIRHAHPSGNRPPYGE
jgi:hypothetical protein